jgi:hypothetical protein
MQNAEIQDRMHPADAALHDFWLPNSFNAPSLLGLDGSANAMLLLATVLAHMRLPNAV